MLLYKHNRRFGNRTFLNSKFFYFHVLLPLKELVSVMYIDKVNLKNRNQININNKNLPVTNFANFSNRISFCSNFDSDIAEFSIKIKKRKESQGIISKTLNSFLKFIGIIPSKKQYQQNIEYKEAETLDEAIKFGQKTFGIKKYEGFDEEDLDIVNWINEGLVKCSNVSKGIIAMPKKVVFEDLDNGQASIDPLTLNLSVDKNQYRQLKYLFGGEKPNFKEALIREHELYQNGEQYQSLFSTVNHEMGHIQHYANIGETQLILSLSTLSNKIVKEIADDIPIIRRLNKDETAIKMVEIFENSKTIAEKVSEYAATSPLEFVAECYAKMVDGIKLDDDVMQLYIKLGGVII